MDAIKKFSIELASELIELKQFSKEEISEKVEVVTRVNYINLLGDFRTEIEKKYDKLVKEQHKYVGTRKYVELGYLVSSAKKDLKKINIAEFNVTKQSELSKSRKRYNILKQFIIDRCGSEILIGLGQHIEEELEKSK